MSNASFRCKPPTWNLIPAPSVSLPCRLRLLNNCCVCFMTSNTPIKESAAMRVHPARAAPPRKPDDQIAPHPLWSHLTVSQQQHVRQVLLGVAQQLLAHRPSQSHTKEVPHAPGSQSESSENYSAPSRTQGGDL